VATATVPSSDAAPDVEKAKMQVPLFLCIGFMIAVLYLDLVFDVSAVPYRQAKGPLPDHILEPIATYYRYVTRNPYLLMFVMAIATISIIAELIYGLAPAWKGYASLVLMGLAMIVGVVRVIPTAERLGTGKGEAEQRTRMVHSMFPAHVFLLITILLLAAVQLTWAFD